MSFRPGRRFSISLRLACSLGALGAVLMFVADLVLYYPTTTPPRDDKARLRHDRSAASYFSTIDPGGSQLHVSSMRCMGRRRVMLGGALGPVSAFFYALGFVGLFPALSTGDYDNDNPLFFLWNNLPALLCVTGLSLLMVIASVYHALFAYTCFLSQLYSAHPTSNDAATQRLPERSSLMSITRLKCGSPRTMVRGGTSGDRSA